MKKHCGAMQKGNYFNTNLILLMINRVNIINKITIVNNRMSIKTFFISNAMQLENVSYNLRQFRHLQL